MPEWTKESTSFDVFRCFPMFSDGKIIKNYLVLRVNGTVPEIVGVTLVPLVKAELY